MPKALNVHDANHAEGKGSISETIVKSSYMGSCNYPWLFEDWFNLTEELLIVSNCASQE